MVAVDAAGWVTAGTAEVVITTKLIRRSSSSDAHRASQHGIDRHLGLAIYHVRAIGGPVMLPHSLTGVLLLDPGGQSPVSGYVRARTPALPGVCAGTALVG